MKDSLEKWASVAEFKLDLNGTFSTDEVAMILLDMWKDLKSILAERDER